MIFLDFCLFFILLQGFFAAMEISVISSSLLKLRHRQDRGDKRAGVVYNMLISPERFLATTLVGINLSIVLSSSFITFFLMQLGVKESSLWATVIITPVAVIFGELIPKNIGRYFREDFSCGAVRVYAVFDRILLVFVNSIEAMSKFLVGVFIGNVRRRSLFVTKEEVRYLIKEIADGGGIDKGEKGAIDEVFKLGNKKVKDVCLRLKKAHTLNYFDSYEKIIQEIRGAGLTRYPVVKKNEIVGYINIYDLFYNNSSNWQSFIRPIVKVGVGQKVFEVLSGLKMRKDTIAVVMKGSDIYGIVTLHDLIKETVTSIVKI